MLRSLQPALAERALEEVQAPSPACTDSAPASCGPASRRTPTRLAASAPQHGAWQEPLPLPSQAHLQCSDLVRASCWFARPYVVSSLDDVHPWSLRVRARENAVSSHRSLATHVVLGCPALAPANRVRRLRSSHVRPRLATGPGQPSRLAPGQPARRARGQPACLAPAEARQGKPPVSRRGTPARSLSKSAAALLLLDSLSEDPAITAQDLARDHSRTTS